MMDEREITTSSTQITAAQKLVLDTKDGAAAALDNLAI
jgi:hypothetical protein